MSEMNLNLIPSKAKFQAARIRIQKQVRLSAIIIIMIWTSVAAIIFSLTLIVKVRVNSAMANQKKVQLNYNSMKDNIVTSQKLKYKAKMVGGVLNNRFEYGTSFETINNLFPPTISLKNFDLHDGGIFLVKGITSEKVNVDLLESMVETINRGENDKLKSARLTALTLKGGVWDFTLEVELR
ncbi:hypothetical protein HYV64_04335 [Candidatus Shapirobacteria bacterium]|nr:hypothetical protein [Candidatus Shapirobacteria bacterium]